MSKHTPGPYKLRPPNDDNTSYWCIVTDDDDTDPWVLAELAGGFEDEDTPRVNGEMLVRAANSHADLLAALKKAEAHIRLVSGNGETDLRAELNAAIKKAEGL